MELIDAVYDLTRNFPKEELFGLTSQMRRAAVSIAANIAEGSQRTTAKDFANFILMAKGSLVELETELLVSQKQKLGNTEKTKTILEKTDELGRMIHSFYKKLTCNP